jgi:hypothetical protein
MKNSHFFRCTRRLPAARRRMRHLYSVCSVSLFAFLHDDDADREIYFQSAAFVLSARTYICIVCVCERRTLVRILPRHKYTCTLASSYIHFCSQLEKCDHSFILLCALLARALSIFYFAPCLFYE